MKLRLGDLLVREGLLTAQQLQAALDHQRRHPGFRKIGETILALKLTTEEQMLAVLSSALRIPSVDLSKVNNVDPATLGTVDVLTAERELVLPLQLETRGPRRRLLLAMADPTNLAAIDNLQFRLGLTVEARLSTISQIRAAIQRLYRMNMYGGPSHALELETASQGEPERLELITSGSVRTWVGPAPTGEGGAGPFAPTVAELRVFSGPARGQNFPLPAAGTLVFGRDNSADIAIADARMSRRHFQVQDTRSGIELTDLGSSNGTYVNKKLVTRTVVHQGDWIQAGNTLIQLHMDAS